MLELVVSLVNTNWYTTMFKPLTRLSAILALSAGLAGVAQAQSFTDLAYNSPVNPLAGQAGQPSHLCQWNGQTIANGYAGGNWSGFAALDLRDYLFSGEENAAYGRCFRQGRRWYNYVGLSEAQSLSGYQQQYSAFNANSTNVLAIGAREASFTRSSPFTLQSMLIGAGWGNVSKLAISGWLNGSQVWFDDSFSFLGTGGAFTTFGKAGLIDEVRFSATYDTGANKDPYNTIGEQLGYGYETASAYETFFIDNIQTATVPEPGTFSLVAVGLAGLAGAARRRRKNQ